MAKVNAKNKDATSDPCSTGKSYGRRSNPHVQGSQVRCYKCDTFLGCKVCCEIPRELVCLRCHEWANRIALKVHGPMVHDRAKGAEAMKIVQMIYKGSISQTEGEKLLNELFPGSVTPEPLVATLRYPDGTTPQARELLSRIWRAQDDRNFKGINNPEWYKG